MDILFWAFVKIQNPNNRTENASFLYIEMEMQRAVAKAYPLVKALKVTVQVNFN
jgi:hypothetical protein